MALKAAALGWPAEAAIAKATSRVLASHLQDAAPVELRLPDGTPVALPAPALRLLVDTTRQLIIHLPAGRFKISMEPTNIEGIVIVITNPEVLKYIQVAPPIAMNSSPAPIPAQ
jgi:hypothetical protein